MKLSIIVPIYNVEKYLPQCIDSILNQDYVDFELILVNDGSPDDSLSICRQYAEKDKRVRVINKPNGGSTSSRKAGAKIAKGEYVICVDGDDYVEQGYFSCVARSLDEFNPDMVVLSHYSLEDNKKILRKDFVVQGLLQDKEYEEVRDKFIYDPTDKNISNPGIISYSLWCKVVRREIYVKAQEQVDDKIVIGEDMLCSLYCLQLAKSMVCLNDSFYVYRILNNSMMHSYNVKKFEHFENLPRTEGISSSEVRSEQCKLRMGIVGKAAFRTKFVAESKYVNGVDVIGVCASQKSEEPEFDGMFYTENYDELLEKVDAVYIVSKPEKHYIDTKKALLAGKHVLCESPIALKEADCEELYSIAEEHGLVLMDAIKTAYSTAYERLVLLAKTGKIGKVVSVDAVCTSLRDGISIAGTDLTQKWNSMCGWAPAALLPVFQILGTEYRKKVITTKFLDEAANMDAFTKIDFTYGDAVASIKVAKAAKSEGELIVTGTKGYIYVPAPWWKTDYFEVRYENAEDNQRFFYQLDGEGIRYEIVAFAKSVEVKKPMNYVEKGVSKSIAKIIESFNDRTDMIVI